MNFIKTFVTVGLLASAFTASAVIDVATWTFETPQSPDPLASSSSWTWAAEEGSGTMVGYHKNPGTIWTTPAGNGTANSIRSTIWMVGDYLQFQTSTLGYQGIGLSWEQTRNNQGPANFSLSYSLDGSTFTQISTYSVVSYGLTPWQASSYASGYTRSFDLSEIPEVNNASSLFIRLTATSPALGNAGTIQVDNFSIVAVPEPAEYAALGAVGLIGLWFGRGLIRKLRPA